MAQKVAEEPAVPAWEYLFLAAYEVETNFEGDKPTTTIVGGTLKVEGEVDAYFGGLFARSEASYPILVDFEADGGKQQNPVRDLVRKLAAGTAAERRKATKDLAHRMGISSPPQAKAGMLVAMVGKMGKQTRVVLWRFTAGASLRLIPPKEGDEAELKIDQHSFNKHNKQFKACQFQDEDGATAFWHGRVLDRQVHESDVGHARYWVEGFLQAISQVTDTRGTKIFSRAIRAALKETKGEPKAQLIAAAKLVQTQKKPLSLQRFADEYLDEDLRPVFLSHTPPEVRATPFTLSKDLVSKAMGMRRITVDNVIQVRAPTAVWNQRVVLGPKDADGRQDITIRGKITAEEDLAPE